METRGKILKTGLKLFSKRGYLGTTTKEIARDAGIAEVTLFRHFPSKEKLFEEVINTYSFLPALKELLPEIEKLPYEDGLRVIARNFLNTLALRKNLIRIMHSEIPQYPETIQKIYHTLIDEILKTLASYFSEMQKRGILRMFDTELSARAFLGMFLSYFNARHFLMRKKYQNSDTDMVIREYVSLFTLGTKKYRSNITR
ncbi:MAG TPA: TetR/AcrR family transcriptional regulator [Thermodesulfobacteriota bacterium]|nr:TetR/AcrR family transcriptional regulator [Thermodesulfobacteriota bacterium]